MLRVVNLLLVLITFVMTSCYEEETECFDSKRFLRLNFITSSDVDSVQFYLGGKQVCVERNEVSSRVLCRLSSESESIEDISFSKESMDSCLVSEDYPRWIYIGCALDEKDKIGTDSLELSVRVFSGEKSETVKMSAGVLGGNHYNVVSEQDTSKWYSAMASAWVSGYNYYGPSSRWNRVGCFDGYCLAAHTIDEQQFCYDK